jgi:hypothetical protein
MGRVEEIQRIRLNLDCKRPVIRGADRAPGFT